MSGGVIEGVSAAWHALRRCDEYEHIVCDNGHEVGGDTNDREGGCMNGTGIVVIGVCLIAFLLLLGIAYGGSF